MDLGCNFKWNFATIGLKEKMMFEAGLDGVGS